MYVNYIRCFLYECAGSFTSAACNQKQVCQPEVQRKLHFSSTSSYLELEPCPSLKKKKKKKERRYSTSCSVISDFIQLQLYRATEISWRTRRTCTRYSSTFTCPHLNVGFRFTKCVSGFTKLRRAKKSSSEGENEHFSLVRAARTEEFSRRSAGPDRRTRTIFR